MIFQLAGFSTWSIGVMNGYMLPDKRLPASYTWNTIALTSSLAIVRSFGSITLPIKNPKEFLFATFIGLPCMVGTLFCVGNFVGKSVRHTISDATTAKIQNPELVIN